MQAGYSVHTQKLHLDVSSAAQMLSKGKKQPEEVVQILRAQGRNEKEVKSILEKAQQEIIEARQDVRYKDRNIGGIICLLGLMVSVLSFHFFEPGLKFSWAYLAVIYGAFRFVRGFRSVS